MHKFIPVYIKTLIVAPAVDLRFNFCIKYIDKIVDAEGFELISRWVNVRFCVNLS